MLGPVVLHKERQTCWGQWYSTKVATTASLVEYEYEKFCREYRGRHVGASVTPQRWETL